MGSPMTQNLINAGCDVAVWNRTESKCNPPLSRWVQSKAATNKNALTRQPSSISHLNLDTGLTGCDDNDESDMKNQGGEVG
ncbi:glyoxylate/succinic semialdehyde reductase 2, chloroplastic-like isoform X2 [Rhododendron vialii]|uniref:glyoxylate/succinic semialdehyde reductase 2, chloroplastic-like isoform X2 n=1 Tax=Rhododendron vialii TaxID=182163 RepID=UPI00265E3AAD|nr:glyoxylate/succinic semialdehyde reductase 2, chloroplastic-like isoform X2 [Rhododendron vialii]